MRAAPFTLKLDPDVVFPFSIEPIDIHHLFRNSPLAADIITICYLLLLLYFNPLFRLEFYDFVVQLLGKKLYVVVRRISGNIDCGE